MIIAYAFLPEDKEGIFICVLIGIFLIIMGEGLQLLIYTRHYSLTNKLQEN